MRLRLISGEPFAIGEARCRIRPAVADDRLTRLFVEVAIGGSHTAAVIDTGGAYLLLSPDVAASAGCDRTSAFGRDRIHIRGIAHQGTLHRLDLTLIADSGDSVTFDATAFVPELEEGDPWPLPSYLGWQGCLERVRLAIDPGDETVYFGPVAG